MSSNAIFIDSLTILEFTHCEMFKSYLDTASSVTISGNGNPNPNLGDQRVMMCTADANPEAVITLYRREGRDTVQVGNSARNSLSLTITMTKEINKDLFYCTATSSNTELLIYSKDSDTKYYTVLCKYISSYNVNEVLILPVFLVHRFSVCLFVLVIIPKLMN